MYILPLSAAARSARDKEIRYISQFLICFNKVCVTHSQHFTKEACKLNLYLKLSLVFLLSY